jgi:homoserine O-succinyltransferase/O-acetyltransferase
VPDGYATTSTSATHLDRFYRPFAELPHARIDAVIVTGAPVECMAFEDVRYWPGMARLFHWLDMARVPAFHLCWAAQAALHYYHGVRKHVLARKRFGLYPHVPVGSGHALLKGVDLPFFMPVSRHSETRISDLSRHPSLRPMLVAPVSGIGMVRDRDRPAIYCLNHPEYAATRLHNEFLRDRRAGKLVDPPVAYYRDGRVPPAFWRTASEVLFRNWIAEVAAADPRISADVALDWLLRAERAGGNRAFSGQYRPH